MICGHAELSSNQPPANASWLAPGGGDDGASVLGTVAGATVVGTALCGTALVVASVVTGVDSVSSPGNNCGSSDPAGVVAANNVLERAGSSSARTTMRCDAERIGWHDTSASVAFVGSVLGTTSA